MVAAAAEKAAVGGLEADTKECREGSPGTATLAEAAAQSVEAMEQVRLRT